MQVLSANTPFLFSSTFSVRVRMVDNPPAKNASQMQTPHPLPISHLQPPPHPKQCGSSKVASEGRALVVAANKSDLSGVTPKEYAQGVIAQVEELMPDMRAPPVVSVCALNGKRLCLLVCVFVLGLNLVSLTILSCKRALSFPSLFFFQKTCGCF